MYLVEVVLCGEIYKGVEMELEGEIKKKGLEHETVGVQKLMGDYRVLRAMLESML